MNTEKLLNLHVLRGLAALYVAMGHAKVVFWSGGQAYLQQYPRAGWGVLDYGLFAIDMASSAAREMVIVFFVLSGFFIQHSFAKNQWRWGDFMLNRAVRIYPPYLASALFAVLVYVFIAQYNPYLFSGELTRPIVQRMAGAYQDFSLTTGLKSLVFIPGKDYLACNFSYWSLLSEAIFYLMAPLVVLRPYWFLGAGAACFVGGNFLMTLVVHDHDIANYFINDMLFFGIGCALYAFLQNRRITLFNRWVAYALTLFFLVLTIGLALIEKPWFSYPAAAGLAVCGMITLLEYPMSKNWMSKLLQKLGDVSYTLYVFHLPFYFLLYALLTQYTGTYIFFERTPYWVAALLILPFSYLLYRLVERPSLSLIRYLKTRK